MFCCYLNDLPKLSSHCKYCTSAWVMINKTILNIIGMYLALYKHITQ